VPTNQLVGTTGVISALGVRKHPHPTVPTVGLQLTLGALCSRPVRVCMLGHSQGGICTLTLHEANRAHATWKSPGQSKEP
jgi:hypothetical protein